MLKQIDAKSRHAILPEVDMESVPASQVGVDGIRYTKIPMKNTLQPNSTGPFEFQLSSNSKTYINLKRSSIIWTFNITDKNGAAIPAKNTENQASKTYATCQGIGGAFGKQFLLHINGTLVESSSINAAYRCYVENELMLSHTTKQSTLSNSGYYPDETMEDEEGLGYLARHELVSEGKLCQVASRIPLDLAGQDKLLLNYMDVRLTVFTNESKFLIDEFEAKSTENLRINLKDVYIRLCEYQVNDGLSNALEKYLLTNRITYALNSVQLRSLYIPAGSMHSPNFQVFNTHAPKRISIGLVSAASYNGDFNKSSFNFQHFNLKNLYVDVGGVTYPSRPWNLDFGDKTSSFIEAFVSTQDALGFTRSTESNGITREMFKKGWNIYSFEISPAIHTPLVDLLKSLSVTVRLEFSEAVQQGGIYCIVFLEVDQTLTIDGQRQVYVDSLT